MVISQEMQRWRVISSAALFRFETVCETSLRRVWKGDNNIIQTIRDLGASRITSQDKSNVDNSRRNPGFFEVDKNSVLKKIKSTHIQIDY